MNLNLSRRKLMVSQFFFRLRVAKLSEQHLFESFGKPIGLEFGPERGDPAGEVKIS